MSLIPNVLWAQRKDKVYITVDVPDIKNEKVSLDPSGKLTFEGTSDSKHYKIDLELFKEIDVEKSKWVVQPRNVQFLLEKKESGPYWDRLLKASGKQWFLKADWNKWKDEDEGDEEFDMSNFDMGSGFPGMPGGGGMGGMGGLGNMMGGMGGMDGMDFGDEGGDSDDEDLPDLEAKSDGKEEEEEEGKGKGKEKASS